MAKNRTYTDAFRAEVLGKLQAGEAIEKVAETYAVTPQTIRNWRKRGTGSVHEQRTPMAARRSLREIPENTPEFLRTERQRVQAQLEQIDSMISRYSVT